MKLQVILAAVSMAFFAAPAFAQPAPEDIMARGDTNKDGGIDKAEWAAMGAPVDYPEQADTNHDGKIDLAELRVLFAQFQANGGPPPQQPPAPPAPAPAPAPAAPAQN